MSLDLERLIAEAVERAVRESTAATTAITGYLNIPGIAKHFAVSPRTIRQAIKSGLPSIGTGKLRRIRIADFESWLRSGTPDATDLEARAVELVSGKKRRRGSP